MTASASRGEIGTLHRPRGYAPRGTSMGVVGASLLAVGVPFFVLECAAPFLRNGVDRWLAAIPFVMASGLVPCFGFVAFAYTRALWTVRLFFYFGCAMLLAYAAGVLFAAAAASRLLPMHEPDLAIMPTVGLIALVLLSPAAWFLLRALRLHYWQPWAPPEAWEAGDERPPAWSLSPRR